MKPSFAAFMFAALLVPALAFAGGHATIAVSELPKRMEAGRAVAVDFTIHDAAGQPMSRLQPTLVATLGRTRLEVPAAPGRRPGSYQAELRFPRSGAWTLTVDSHFCGNTHVMRNVAVLASR